MDTQGPKLGRERRKVSIVNAKYDLFPLSHLSLTTCLSASSHSSALQPSCQEFPRDRKPWTQSLEWSLLQGSAYGVKRTSPNLPALEEPFLLPTLCSSPGNLRRRTKSRQRRNHHALTHSINIY